MAELPKPAETGDQAGRARSAIAYRPDIDGLRCIAVTAVVMFHAGLAGIPGGFVGVDIFFVISGFLIGGQVYREAHAQGFSFLAFYARRLRRIMPALLFLLLVMTVLGAVMMTPAEFRDFGKEAVPTIFGLSNILYYMGGGYFAQTADYNSLLMTWSLGIEEQFYVIFPIVILILRKARIRILKTLCLLSALSFIGSLVLTEQAQKAAFYLLPTRAWELGLGTILAIWLDRRVSGDFARARAEGAAMIGVALLAFGIVGYRDAIAFPGVFAAIPVMGTALLIAARGSTINRQLLSWRPVVFVGQVSYSWYLWHWPLFYYFRLLRDQGVAGPGPWLSIIVSFGFAVLSWRFIEQPFRRRVLAQKTVVCRYAVAATVAAGCLFAIFAGNGLVDRLSPRAQVLAEQARIARQNPCLARYGETTLSRLPACVPAAAPGQVERLLVIGDSHASAMAAGFEAIARREGLAFGELTKSSCLPLIGYAVPAPERPGHHEECLAFQREAFAYVRAHPEIRIVVLGGYWASGKDRLPEVEASDGSRLALADALTRTIARLHDLGRKVVIVHDTPAFGFDPYARVIGAMMPGRGAVVRATAGGHGAFAAVPQPDSSRSMIASVARRVPETLAMDPWRGLCAGERCAFRDDQRLYYFDQQHLTREGAIVAVRGELAFPR
jgi:peptidoglycan/LPS O-acetylase OafA/YrhL